MLLIGLDETRLMRAEATHRAVEPLWGTPRAHQRHSGAYTYLYRGAQNLQPGWRRQGRGYLRFSIWSNSAADALLDPDTGASQPWDWRPPDWPLQPEPRDLPAQFASLLITPEGLPRCPGAPRRRGDRGSAGGNSRWTSGGGWSP